MKTKTLIPFIVALAAVVLCLALGAQSAQAAGVVTVCDDAHLSTALSGGGLVTFDCGPATLVINSSHSVGVNTTIDGSNNGNPLTLTAAVAVRVFQVSSGAVLTLVNVTAANWATSQQAIYVQAGGLVVSGSHFISNSAGIIYSQGAVTVTSSTFERSSADVLLQTTASGASLIRDSVFVSNTARPVVVWGAAPTIIENTRFENTTLAGGGVYGVLNSTGGSPLTVISSVFISNSGAAIYDFGGAAFISNTQFISTSTRYEAIYFDYAGAVQIADSTFLANAAGGIYFNGASAPVRVDNTQFISNSSIGGTGAIRTGSQPLTLTRSLVSGNWTTSNNYAGGIVAGGTAYISGTLFVQNSGPQAGGALLEGSSAFVSRVFNSRFISNTATVYGGGGVHATTPTIVDNTEFSGNVAQGNNDGGGMVIGAYSSALTMTRSLFFSNTVTGTTGGAGGGLSTSYYAVIANTTFYSNSAPSSGGVYASGAATLTNVTLVSNTATYALGTGGNLRAGGLAGAVALLNSIVSGGRAQGSGANCGGNAIRSLGHNLSSDATCQITATGDLSGTPALLDVFQDNGGFTWSLMPLSGSAAINAAAGAGCPADDQRGAARPQASACDIGAIETPYLTPQSVVFGALADRLKSSSPFTLTATASSGLAVTFSSQTPSVCTVNGVQVTLLDAPATCTIRASQSGDGTYQPAFDVDRSFNVTLVYVYLPVIRR